MTVRVAVLDDYQGAGASHPQWQRLAGRIAVDGFPDTLSDESALVQRLLPYKVIVPIRERTVFTGSLLRRLPALELLALTGGLSGQVDIETATSRNVLVTETGRSEPSAIEMTMALMLALAHRVPQEHAAMRSGLWQTGVGFELAGKTLGILGLGRIGKAVATLATGFGMKVLAWSPNLTADRAKAAGARYRSQDDLFRESDVVTLHLRLSDETRELVTARHIGLMKTTACLINTARGRLIDEQALVDALSAKRIGGAALDVFQKEPLPVDHPLRFLDNVVLTPHMGTVSTEAYQVFFGGVVDNITAYLDGRSPAGLVNLKAPA